MLKSKRMYGFIILTAVVLGIIITATTLKMGSREERVINSLELEELTRAHWSSQELENARIVLEFVQRLMNNHEFDYVRSAYGNNPYKQHNRGMKDGIEGVITTLEDFTGQYPNFSYDVKNIYIDGPYVTLHSHATLHLKDRGNPNKGMNIYDTWKVEGGLIVEHWDSIQGIDSSMRFYGFLTGGSIKNNNTLF